MKAPLIKTYIKKIEKKIPKGYQLITKGNYKVGDFCRYADELKDEDFSDILFWSQCGAVGRIKIFPQYIFLRKIKNAPRPNIKRKR